MSSKELSEDVFGTMLATMVDAFTEERKKTEPYKEMFKAGSSFTGLLRHLDSEMSSHILDACDAHKERTGASFTSDQYNVLLALPLLVMLATKDAEREGAACCVDKAFFMLSEQLLGLAE